MEYMVFQDGDFFYILDFKQSYELANRGKSNKPLNISEFSVALTAPEISGLPLKFLFFINITDKKSSKDSDFWSIVEERVSFSEILQG